jgi:transcriptional regulator with XRE-family HTH domain
MGFKENLKAELEFQDMQVKELSDVTGISRHTISNYLSVRERIPTADVAVKIAKALGVSVEYLVTGEENHLEKPLIGTEIHALIQNYKLLRENDRKMVIAITQLYKNQERTK